MEQLTRQLSAVQTAATASIVTAALLSLPLFAASTDTTVAIRNEYDAKHLVSVFQKTGAETTGSFTNRSIDESGFDFTAYRSNTCFSPTENDLAACRQEFGAYADLRATYESGELNVILETVPYLKDAAAFAPAPKTMQTMERSPESEGASNSVQLTTPIERLIRERSEKLWKECQIKEPSREAASRCYQRNIRRTQEWNQPAEGNVY